MASNKDTRMPIVPKKTVATTTRSARRIGIRFLFYEQRAGFADDEQRAGYENDVAGAGFAQTTDRLGNGMRNGGIGGGDHLGSHGAGIGGDRENHAVS